MASFVPSSLGSLGLSFSLFLSLLIILPVAISAGPKEAPLTHQGGRMLTGNLNIGILWYGPIPRVQKEAILSFLRSLNNQPQVSSWWNIVESYQTFSKTPVRGNPKIPVKVVNEQDDPNYSLGKVLIKDFIKLLLPKATGGKPNTLAIIIASKGITVQDMCAGSCAQHGLIGEQPYVAVGDPEEECPECAWPFGKSSRKPRGAIVKPPSGDIGADVMVRLLAGGLAGAVTNPYGDGFYTNGRGDRLIEATTKCPDILGKVLVDPKSGGSFNARGDGNNKFLLPAIWNPKSSSCWTPM